MGPGPCRTRAARQGRAITHALCCHAGYGQELCQSIRRHNLAARAPTRIRCSCDRMSSQRDIVSSGVAYRSLPGSRACPTQAWRAIAASGPHRSHPLKTQSGRCRDGPRHRHAQTPVAPRSGHGSRRGAPPGARPRPRSGAATPLPRHGLAHRRAWRHGPFPSSRSPGCARPSALGQGCNRGRVWEAATALGGHNAAQGRVCGPRVEGLLGRVVAPTRGDCTGDL